MADHEQKANERSMTIVVTGGAGFIGSNFILDWLSESSETIVNIDKLSYAADLSNLDSLDGDSRHVFVEGDIGDSDLVTSLFARHAPRAVINFAAESHVDRSIEDASPFITSNIVGTFKLLEIVRKYLSGQNGTSRSAFRFVQVSTDEVFGSLGSDDAPFTERTPYQPNSPYSASKAAADHLVRAYHRTYGLPTLTTNCSNNFGPYQHPEKFIPVVIRSALAEKPIPVYGDGRNIRDWLYVRDHCSALRTVLEEGTVGESYAIGGDSELSNLDLAHRICGLLDEIKPRPDSTAYSALITSVADRPGHDFRYSIDSSKLSNELGWKQITDFDAALRETVLWYAARYQDTGEPAKGCAG
jgi:dTDP-glucose 4,6-dehydratase